MAIITGEDFVNDVLVSLPGDDLIDGKSGFDIVDYKNAIAGVTVKLVTGTATGGAGNDTLVNIEGAFGSNFQDILTGNRGNNTLSGGNGDDTLTGGVGNDTFKGGNGFDAVVESGNVNFVLTDTKLTGLGTDSLDSVEFAFLTGGSGNNVLDASDFSSSTSLTGGNGKDTLLGGSDNDSLIGDDGFVTGDGVPSANGDNDFLDGGAGDDFLDGGAGNDSLFGAGSASKSVGTIDTLTGGLGRDAFVLGDANSVFYNDGNFSTSGTNDFALIQDFKPGEDTIQLNKSATYFLGSSPVNGISGTAIFQFEGFGSTSELIGIVQNVSGLNLASNNFTFVG